jgi:hypothetical protein
MPIFPGLINKFGANEPRRRHQCDMEGHFEIPQKAAALEMADRAQAGSKLRISAQLPKRRVELTEGQWEREAK